MRQSGQEMKAAVWLHGDVGSWERWGARGISAIWALFWIWFGIANVLSEGISTPGVLLQAAAPGFAFALLAALAWWKEHSGGILLILTGLLTYAAYWHMAGGRGLGYWFAIGSILALPQLVSGALFLAASHHSRQ